MRGSEWWWGLALCACESSAFVPWKGPVIAKQGIRQPLSSGWYQAYLWRHLQGVSHAAWRAVQAKQVRVRGKRNLKFIYHAV